MVPEVVIDVTVGVCVVVGVLRLDAVVQVGVVQMGVRVVVVGMMIGPVWVVLLAWLEVAVRVGLLVGLTVDVRVVELGPPPRLYW